MNNKNIETKIIPSPLPFYIAMMIAVISTFILPMYKFTSWIFVAAIAVISNFIIRKLKLFKDEVIEIEIPVVYADSEIEALVKLGEEQVRQLEILNYSIDTLHVHEDIHSIITTSEKIIAHIKENQKIERDVRKYFRYYLDEIIKMVQHYNDFEELNNDSDHIRISKEKIEATLANAKTAFNKFYNDLYAGKAMDISVDTKVFDSMLKQLD